MISKVKIRKKDRKDEFINYIESDIEYANFDDLGVLIYKQSSGFNQPEKVLEDILTITVDKFEEFKNGLQGNYTKYFKENFRNKNFEGLWKELFSIRNKVAHQGTFYNKDLERGEVLFDKLTELIKNAESGIDEIVLSIKDQEAMRQANIEKLTEEENSPDDIKNEEIEGVKVVGKINLPSATNRTFRGFKVISEDKLYEELELYLENNQFVDLKSFVTQYLADKNYDISFSYSLINILSEKGKIELYDIEAYDGYNIKAIKKVEN